MFSSLTVRISICKSNFPGLFSFPKKNKWVDVSHISFLLYPWTMGISLGISITKNETRKEKFHINGKHKTEIINFDRALLTFVFHFAMRLFELIHFDGYSIRLNELVYLACSKTKSRRNKVLQRCLLLDYEAILISLWFCSCVPVCACRKWPAIILATTRSDKILASKKITSCCNTWGVVSSFWIDSKEWNIVINTVT